MKAEGLFVTIMGIGILGAQNVYLGGEELRLCLGAYCSALVLGYFYLML